MIETDLSKQHAPDAKPKVVQKIDFTGNLDQPGNTAKFFIIEKSKKKHFIFFTINSESIVSLF